MKWVAPLAGLLLELLPAAVLRRRQSDHVRFKCGKAGTISLSPDMLLLPSPVLRCRRALSEWRH